jgi:hypothetical protein
VLNEAQGLRAEGGRLGAVVTLLPAASVSGLPQRIERTAQSLTLAPLAGAQAWRWQVATDAAFTRLLQDERTMASTWLLTGLPDGDYYLRVRAADAQGLEGREAQLPPGHSRTTRTAVADVARTGRQRGRCRRTGLD